MCGSMVDIQSRTAENRRGKYEERGRKTNVETPRVKYNGMPITTGGHNNESNACQRRHCSVAYTISAAVATQKVCSPLCIGPMSYLDVDLSAKLHVKLRVTAADSTADVVVQS